MPTLKSILVVAGPAETAQDALATAGALALHTGAELHVIQTSWLLRLPAGHVARALFRPALYQREIYRDLDKRLQRELPAGIEPASRVIETRSCAPAIIQRAALIQADVIVVAPPPSAARSPLDPTFREVVEGVTVPVLVARGRLSLPASRAVMPVDGKAPLVATDQACRWLSAAGGQVVGSTRSPTELEVIYLVRIGHEWSAAERPENEGTGGSCGLQVRIRSRALVATSTMAAAHDLARREDADLLIAPLETLGHGGARRQILGVLQRALVARARTPLLLLPAGKALPMVIAGSNASSAGGRA